MDVGQVAGDADPESASTSATGRRRSVTSSMVTTSAPAGCGLSTGALGTGPGAQEARRRPPGSPAMPTPPEVLRLTAFSDDPAGGNPAGVVLDASRPRRRGDARDRGRGGLLGDRLRHRAPTAPTLAVRYFSPLAEVPFCGHATIATGVAWARRHGPGALRLATASGAVGARRARRGRPPGRDPDERRPARRPRWPTTTSTRRSPRWAGGARSSTRRCRRASPGRAPRTPSSPRPTRGPAGRPRLRLRAPRRAHGRPRLDHGAARLARGRRRRSTPATRSRPAASSRTPRPARPPRRSAPTCASCGLVDPPATLTIHQGDDLGRPSLLRVDVPPEGGIRVSGTAVPLG